MFTFFVILACASALAAAFYIGANYGYDKGYEDGWEHGEKCATISEEVEVKNLKDDVAYFRDKLLKCECMTWPKPEVVVKKKAGRPKLSKNK